VSRESGPAGTQLRVLGIDPGTLHTGWGVVERTRRGLFFRAGDVVSAKGFHSLPERLRVIYEEIVAVIDRWAPHALSLEKAFVAHNVQSALRLGEARGTILLAAAQAGLEIAEYNPTEIKTAVAGYGRADKMQIQKSVFAQLRHAGGEGGEFPSSLDATDALAAAVCHCGAAGIPDILRQAGVHERRKGGARSRSLRDVFTERTVGRMLAAEQKKRG